MPRKYLLVSAVIIAVFLVLVARVGLRPSPTLQKLPYAGIQTIRVGDHPITIQTQTLVTQDNGPAKIIITSSSTRIELDSWFDHDNWMDIRPGYLSWREVDDHAGPDLILWQPSGPDAVIASEYISSSDGQLHRLPAPLKRQHDMSAQFLSGP